MPDDPRQTRRTALAADVERICELLAQCVAEAMALDLPVRCDVYSAAATLDGWAKDLARHI